MSDSSSLPKRRLGRTEMEITRVGLGSWAIGGHGWAFGWGQQDDVESIATIRRALECGINWIDTAPIYGLGHAERILRLLLRELPADRRPLIFTKCGLGWDEADRYAMPRKRGDPQLLRQEVEDSMNRLGVDHIDLYQMHWPPVDETPIDEYWGVLVELKQAGKVRAIGLSNHDVDQLEAAEAVGHVDTLQPPFSAIRREFAANELPWCVAHGTGVIVYSPMQAGLLTGSFSPERVASLSAEDWRSRDPEFQDEHLERNLQLVDGLKAVAQRHGKTIAAVAVAWTLAWPGVTGAIVGARKPQQIDGWLDAATLELSRQDLDEIAAAIRASGAGEGPDLPAGA